MKLRKGMILYHGTSSQERFELEEGTPEGPAWFTDSFDAAEYYATVNEGLIEDDMPRVLVYKVTAAPKLLQFTTDKTDDMLRLQDIWEKATGDRLSLEYTDYGNDLIAEVYSRAEDRFFSAHVVCEGGFDGWFMPDALEADGADIMICDPSKFMTLVSVEPVR